MTQGQKNFPKHKIFSGLPVALGWATFFFAPLKLNCVTFFLYIETLENSNITNLDAKEEHNLWPGRLQVFQRWCQNSETSPSAPSSCGDTKTGCHTNFFKSKTESLPQNHSCHGMHLMEKRKKDPSKYYWSKWIKLKCWKGLSEYAKTIKQRVIRDRKGTFW